MPEDEGWTRVRHDLLGLSLEVPAGLRTTRDAGGAALLAAEDAGPGRLARSVTVAVEHPGAAEGWWAASSEAVVGAVPGGLLVDDRPTRLWDGTPARTLLVAYAHPEGVGAVVEQTLLHHAGRGVVVSCTCDALVLGDLAPAFAHVAGSLRLPAGWPA